MTLFEIQVGVITTSMPSFARMLNHHLPYWKRITSRLSMRRVISQSQRLQQPASTSAPETKMKTAKPRSGQIKMWFDHLKTFDTLNSGTTGENSTNELDNLNSVKTIIKGEQRENVHDDGIYLKHDIERTWSPITSIDPQFRRGGQ
ncbi:MAG: hypothetical protein Q9213_003994 [Squamulea squamosa]